MARVKRGVQAKARHKKVLKEAKGYYGARRKVYRVAKQAVTKAEIEVDRKVLADLAVNDKAAFAALAEKAKASLT
jgi:large subunit ribosomal protein L20